jgi:hypothetical protein
METEQTIVEAPIEVLPARIDHAEIDLQIATAHRYPRDVVKAKLKMQSIATMDPDTAASCFYTLPRGGKAIQGPSIRMAEIALGCWGNLRAATRITSVDLGPNPTVEIEAAIHDLESNVAIRMSKRRRITKKKSKDAPDEDDINLAANAGSAIALRDAVFKIVPRSVVLPVLEQAKLVAAGDAKSLAQRRDAVVKRLEVLGVLRVKIFAAVGVKTIEEIDLEKLGTLIGLGTAIRDGAITIDEAFPDAEVEKQTAEAAFAKHVEKAPEPPANAPEPPAKATAPVPPDHTVSAQGVHAPDGTVVTPDPRVEPATTTPPPAPPAAKAKRTLRKAPEPTPEPTAAPKLSTNAIILRDAVLAAGKGFPDVIRVMLEAGVIQEADPSWKDFGDLNADHVDMIVDSLEDFKGMLLA